MARDYRANPVRFVAEVIWMWAAFTRGSTGLLANYSILFIIDCVGLVRLILA